MSDNDLLKEWQSNGGARLLSPVDRETILEALRERNEQRIKKPTTHFCEACRVMTRGGAHRSRDAQAMEKSKAQPQNTLGR